MKKIIIPILGLLGITIIFYFTFTQEKIEEKEAQLVKSIRWDKEAEGLRLEKKAEKLRFEKEKRLAEEVKVKKQLEELNSYCKSELYNLEGDFNNAEGALWDDDALRRIRTRASTLTSKCKETSYSNDFFKLQKKCNKQLN